MVKSDWQQLLLVSYLNNYTNSYLTDNIFFKVIETEIMCFGSILMHYWKEANKLTSACKRTYGDKFVILSMALPRWNPLYITRNKYLENVRDFNNIMRRQLVSPEATNHGQVMGDRFINARMWFWEHEKIKWNPKLRRDGVHLSRKAQKRLYFSIGMALQEVSSFQIRYQH